MYISNGIAYAGEQEPVTRSAAFVRCPVIGSGSDLQLAKQKVFDFTPLLKDAGLRRWPMNIPLRASILTTV